MKSIQSQKHTSIQTHKTRLTNEEEFSPTPHMERWLDTAIELMTDNISEIERASKVTAQAYYKWLKDSKFCKWYEEEWDKRVKSQAWKLDAIAMKNAKKDYRYWEGMQRRFGRLDNNKSPDVTIPIQINSFDPAKYIKKDL